MLTKTLGFGGSAGVGIAMMALPETGWLGQDIAQTMFWVGLTTATISILGLGWMLLCGVAKSDLGWRQQWLPAWHFKFDGVFPFRRLVALSDAANNLYTTARKSGHVYAATSEFDDSEKGVLNWWGGYIVRDSECDLYGIRTPSTLMEKIDLNEAKNMELVDGSTRLVSNYNSSNYYTDLRIKAYDLRRLTKTFKHGGP